jgi:hypothetical protein
LSKARISPAKSAPHDVLGENFIFSEFQKTNFDPEQTQIAMTAYVAIDRSMKVASPSASVLS